MGALPSHQDIENFAKANPRRFQYMLEKSICADSLMGFIKVFWEVLEPSVDLKTGWALDAMAEHLEALSHDHLDNLLINVPPGMMKSLMCGTFWPLWEWGPLNRPHLQYITCSYAADLAKRNHMKARSLMASERFIDLYGDLIHPSPKKKDNETQFHLAANGSSFATGTGGKLTGWRGDRIIVDDPHSVDGAESDADRTRTVRWFTETLSTRVNDPLNVKRLVIMQRIHEGDVSGHILDNMKGRYEHLCLPMRFEPERRCSTSIGFTDPRQEDGELLMPERFPAQQQDEVEEDMMSQGGEYSVAGQMQQSPSPRGGGMFKLDKAQIVNVLPPNLLFRTRGWDFAGTTKSTSPFTAGVAMGLGAQDNYLYIFDVVRWRMKIHECEQAVVLVAKSDGTAIHQDMPQDPGQSGLSQVNSLSGDLGGLRFSFSPESGDKAFRASPLAAYWNVGKVRLLKAPWNQAFLAEIGKFPAGMFKDQVDGGSRAYARIVKKKKAAPVAPVPPVKVDRPR